MRTPTHLLAIAGVGLILGTGHAIVRTTVFGKPAVSLAVRTPASTDTVTPEPTPTDTPPAEPDAGDPDTAEPTQQAEPVDPLDVAVLPDQITLRRAHELFLEGAFFLDARNEHDFSLGHIEGAIWMPASRANTSGGQSDLEFIPPGDTVVIYCTGGDCDASHNTKHRLELLQYDFDIHILGRGYEDWLAAGLPVEAPEGETP